ncbi:hypothetical protein M8C21_018961, partial [Ambrosia artemisiifolia]
YLKIACDGLKKPMVDFLNNNNTSLDWIICDFATYWLGPIAVMHGVRTAYFSVFPALVLGFMGTPDAMCGGDKRTSVEDFVKRPNWVSFESEVRPSAFHVTRIMQSLTADDENVSDTYRLGTTIRGCDAVVVRSSFGFEPDWLNLLKELYGKPVIPIGLLPTTANDDNDDDDAANWLETKKWLDKYERGSVVYIAFGTETKPSQYELTQLAFGLELSGLPFYWVLIDQLEGLQLGKPLVLLPFMFDQGLIASYLVEKKMAYMVHREDADGSFTPESVADLLSLVMVKEDGKMYREKAKDMMSLFGNRDGQD